MTGDLLAHCIDTALWLNGDHAEFMAMTETFIKERKHTLTGKVEPSASMTPARFSVVSNGSLASSRPHGRPWAKALYPGNQR